MTVNLIVSVLAVSVVGGSSCLEQRVFPPGFMFGASTSAAQIEGAWNASGKSEHIWEKLAHTRPDVVMDGTNSDVACDSYHLWRRDIEMIDELGLDMYRFSISWSRLLPSGFANSINTDGARYYSDLIDALLEKGIQPIVTIYHFDLPQSLQDLGGWANPLIADWFADYARVVYSLYADRVKYWLTINEPIAICDGGYMKMHAPYFDDSKIGRYLCNKNVLLAHAKAWRIYDEEFKPKYHGKVSQASLFIWFEPKTPDDVEATELTIEYWEGRYSHPIFSKEGGWPPRLEKLLAENAKKEGYPQPRLPPFTPEEIQLVKGGRISYMSDNSLRRSHNPNIHGPSCVEDCFAVMMEPVNEELANKTVMVRKVKAGEEPGPWAFYGSKELGIDMESDPNWPRTDIDWFGVYPEGLRHTLHWINASYGPVDIMITENGYPSVDPGLNDRNRLEYIKQFLDQLLLAISDGISVIGYNVWTLMDNFEWSAGYTVRFGLYAVDFSDPLRARSPRDSARYYAGVTRSRTTRPKNDVFNYAL